MESMDKNHTSNFLDDAEVFKLAVESSDLGVWGYDVSSDELFWSRKLYDIMGVEPGTRITVDAINGFMHPEDFEWVQSKIRDSLFEHKPYDIEYRAVRPDTGEIIWGRFTGQASCNEAGKTEKMFGTVVDITHHKMAEFNAKNADRAKSEFLANMSHEIRTPMNGIMGMTQLLANCQLGPREREFVKTIDRSGQALLTIINDILDFSKIEAGHICLLYTSPSPRDS